MEFWDQPRIAAEFGVSVNTVQSSWRNATLRTVRAHLAAAGVGEAELGVPVERLTRQRWAQARAEHSLKALRLPANALPLPDTLLGTKPGWSDRRLRAWAADSGHVNGEGGLGRSRPPGRPAGIVEAGPRRRRTAAA